MCSSKQRKKEDPSPPFLHNEQRSDPGGPFVCASSFTDSTVEVVSERLEKWGEGKGSAGY